MEFKSIKFENNSINKAQNRYISPNLKEKTRSNKNIKGKINFIKKIINKKIFITIFLVNLIFSFFPKFNDYLLNLKYSKDYNYNITGINYANYRFKNAQKLNTFTAIKYGKVNQTIEYNQDNISSSFLKTNKEILSMGRGGGYWIWKPYFILKALKEKVKYNDYLIYADSGSIYIDDIYNLLSVMIKDKIDIMPFRTIYKEKMWTKRDAFLLNCDSHKCSESKQNLATFVLMKNTHFTRSFIYLWLTHAQDKRQVTDQPNVLRKPNYPEFIENRHDQSIYSLLTKKYNLPSYRDPSNWGIYQQYDAKSPFPTIFYSTRNGSFSSLKEVIESKGFNDFDLEFKKIGNYTLQKFADLTKKQ